MIVRCAPCSCGADPLTPTHLERARYDAMCAARVADVRRLVAIRQRGEDR